jgi:hypothetical protein
MSDVKILPVRNLGHGFIPTEFLPPGQNEYHLRDAQSSKPPTHWRRLRADEIEMLVKNDNTCDDWDDILVTERFAPHLVKNCHFTGLVRIGALDDVLLEHHDLQSPAGLTGSRIIACDIGDNCAIHNVQYLAHYILGDHVMLLNIDEMHVTNHAKFGNGIVKDGEEESVRVWMHLINETGGREVAPFDGMIPADAYLWARYRDDDTLMKRLLEITQKQFDSRRGFYGTVGDECVIKNCGIIKDVKVGSCCYIKGANKLKNLTINSSDIEPTQIGEGVELVNGIVGLGCRIFYGCKAIRFVMGNNTHLKYGARLIDSFLGDNSTVSCCEMLNNLIFPAHEQHHNNSFLAASLLMGQSNLAAGATVGSNHNSRANDGEVQAGRGFWPGLCTTLKHYCRFASFTLLAKGDYPAELDIPLPFSLLNDDRANDRLMVMPAFWWMYNMYALARNTWKYQTRDSRKTRTQKIEFDCLAPDTVEEMVTAMRLLEIWVAKAQRRHQGDTDSPSDGTLAAAGRKLLMGPEKGVEGLEVRGEKMEDSRRPVIILKPYRAYHAYRQMLHYYAMKNLLAYLSARPRGTLAQMGRELDGPRVTRWSNLGGQLVSDADVEALLGRIKSGALARWQDIHEAYDRLWEAYPLQKQRHAMAILLWFGGVQKITDSLWEKALDEALRIQQYVCDQVYLSRRKDYDNPFRQTTFRNVAEMKAVVGTAEGNSFVKQVRKETEEFQQLVESVRKRAIKKRPVRRAVVRRAR